MTAPSDHRQPDLPIQEGFIKSSGLSRAELKRVRVRDITKDDAGQCWIHVVASKQAPERHVPVIDGFSWAVIDALRGHSPESLEEDDTLEEALHDRSPDDLLFPLVSPHLVVKKFQRKYAFWLYFETLQQLPIVEYPTTFDEVGEQVRQALGWPQLNGMLTDLIGYAKQRYVRKAWQIGG